MSVTAIKIELESEKQVNGRFLMASDSGFAQDGRLDTMPPSARLCAILEQVTGPDQACDGLPGDDLIGLLGRWSAVEAWAACGKLAVIAALLRRHAVPCTGAGPGGMPRAWDDGLNEEVCMALGVSQRTADKLIDLAWQLAARLAGTRAALHAGIIDAYKAQVIAETTSVLEDDAAIRADADLTGAPGPDGQDQPGTAEGLGARLAGKTPGEIGKLASRIAVAADPQAARKRREDAQVRDARVAVWREPSGTAAIGAFGLPPDAALAAEQAVQDQAAAYKKAGIAGSMDQLRSRVVLDKLTGVSPLDPGAPPAAVRTSVHLTYPASSLSGLSDKPGELAGWGAIDPGLARDIAARAAAAGAGSDWHITIVDDSAGPGDGSGWAVSHGCLKPKPRAKRDKNGTAGTGGSTPGAGGGIPGTGGSTPGAGGSTPSTGGGLGTWTLTLPGGQQLTAQLHAIPVTTCDHSLQTARHDPTPLLRHLVEIRDATCTRPGCARPAARCDFEHATAFDKGGITCACQCGSRCRRDHQLKQRPDWSVAQPLPGFHEWTTPSGRVYTREPALYPA
jgi:hypothetical protein